ncbi:alpha/beta hydrolase [Xanthobacter sp. V4C-4]|uniref:alpha/beta fold hydrolase n=1 Tax=Xanthobacter cornucopiae TaxID=3119924 RepID=UPI00372C3BA4
MDDTGIGKLLPGFQRRRVRTSGAEISLAVAGDGPPLLLLHGHPQTLACWHKVAPALARDFTVVLADLRGYGDSSKPDGGPDHMAYSKREMARDQVEVMRALGFARFAAVGHDRGARVLHRLLLDHPEAVSKAALLDIAPTATMYAHVTKEFATRYMWWFFLIQPAPLPETLIGANLDFYLQAHMDKQNRTPGAIDPAAYAEYRRCYTHETLHAVCEDYRAAAGIDLVHDAADADAMIAAPVLVLWGEKGVVGATYDVLATWREKARDVRGSSLPCGHYLPEEAPDALLAALRDFLS